MRYLVIEELDSGGCYLVGSKPFTNEKQALMCVDLQRECNPHRKYQIVSILDQENLEVVK